MAFLFGSHAKGQVLFDSDVDIAVYFKPVEEGWNGKRGEYLRVAEICGETEKNTGRKC